MIVLRKLGDKLGAAKGMSKRAHVGEEDRERKAFEEEEEGAATSPGKSRGGAEGRTWKKRRGRGRPWRENRNGVRKQLGRRRRGEGGSCGKKKRDGGGR